MGHRRKILLLEDNQLFAETVEDYLSEYDFIVDIAENGNEALEKKYANTYDLYLLDINVPHINGIDFLKLIRDNNDTTPAIFITSYKDGATVKQGFHHGCDDYIKKPLDLEELLLRINALLKRIFRTQEITYIDENLYYDFAQKRLYHDNKDMNLQQKILDLLELFLTNPNRIISKEQIIDKLWSTAEESSDGAIRVYIAKLKKAIGEERVQNIKGIGYIYTA